MKTSGEIKRIALSNLQGRWGGGIGVSAINYGIQYAFSFVAFILAYAVAFAVVLGSMVGGTIAYGAGTAQETLPFEQTLGLIITVYAIIIIVSFVTSLVTANLRLGMYGYHLGFTRNVFSGVTEIFKPFRLHWWRSFALFFMIELKAVLYMLILYIPGMVLYIGSAIFTATTGSNAGIGAVLFAVGFILMLASTVPYTIAYISYSMAPMIFVENPTMSIFEAIKQSKNIMNGHKADYFVLNLSFIGWALLAAFFTCGIGVIFLEPYLITSQCVFYNELIGCPTFPYGNYGTYNNNGGYNGGNGGYGNNGGGFGDNNGNDNGNNNNGNSDNNSNNSDNNSDNNSGGGTYDNP